MPKAERDYDVCLVPIECIEISEDHIVFDGGFLTGKTRRTVPR
jgi:hypothetical protein